MLSIKQTLLLVFSLTSFVVFYIGLLNYLTTESYSSFLVLIFASISSAGVMISTFIISRNITKPIERLDLLMTDFTKNETIPKNKPLKTSIKELNELNQNFEQMVKTVENTIQVEKNLVRELKEVDKQKNEFVAMVSHELKTPLVPIMGYAEMLKKSHLMGQLSPEQSDAVNEIHESSKRLEKLIGDILIAQKLEMGKLIFKNENVDIEKIVSEQIKNFEPLATEKNIQIINSNDIKMTITTDRSRLNQVFSNLITNAIDFVPKENGLIEIGAKDDKSDVIFYVKDNGIGISPDRQKMIFKKFFQADTSPRRSRDGSGLGLSICKGIIERFGGKIWVESKQGKGSTFFFKIPKSFKELISTA